MLKTYNQSNIEQLDVCMVRLRHKDKIARCRFFVVPGIEFLSILNITCNIVGDQQVDR